ncbi:hypothetical protein [Kovacikia minuta]|nr:hypothetical protein [Kovacikia minuta]
MNSWEFARRSGSYSSRDGLFLLSKCFTSHDESKNFAGDYKAEF